MHVLLLHDTIRPGASLDASDVLEQAAAIEGALLRRGDSAERLTCSSDTESLRRRLLRSPPDLVFNLVESLEGRGADIAVPAEIVERCRIPMTGASAEVVRLTSGKLLTKARLERSALPTPAWCSEHALREGRSLSAEVERVIVKSVWEHASIGLDAASVIRRSGFDDAAALAAAIEARRDSLGGEAFVEQFVQGREFNVSMLEAADRNEAQVLPPAEIEFIDWPDDEPHIVGYAAKWDTDSRAYVDTPRRFDHAARDASLLETLTSLARACWQAFDLRGYARVDFRVDEQGNPWILEINTNPCLSPDAGFAAALHAAGITLDEAIARVILAANRRFGDG